MGSHDKWYGFCLSIVEVWLVRLIWRMKIGKHQFQVLKFSFIKLKNENKSFLIGIQYYLNTSETNKFYASSVLENEKLQKKNNTKAPLHSSYWSILIFIAVKEISPIPWLSGEVLSSKATCGCSQHMLSPLGNVKLAMTLLDREEFGTLQFAVSLLYPFMWDIVRYKCLHHTSTSC